MNLPRTDPPSNSIAPNLSHQLMSLFSTDSIEALINEGHRPPVLIMMARDLLQRAKAFDGRDHLPDLLEALERANNPNDLDLPTTVE